MTVCSFEGIISSDGPVAQLVRAPPCHGGGRGFEPHPGRLKRMLHLIAYGILAQLGEHLPYKQRVIGSSPIGSIQCEAICIYVFAGIEECRRGGTGRRTGLKILRDLPPVPVRSRSPALA